MKTRARFRWLVACAMIFAVIGASAGDLASMIGHAQFATLETALGEIEIELDAEHAPNTTTNFKRYVAAGQYDGGFFGRTVRPDNQRSAATPIAVIQAYVNPDSDADAFGHLRLERTRDTGLTHVDGALSMARAGIDDATSAFFVCVGDQPELDFGGKRHPDGQGFAVFGRVIRGMEVVRRIHLSAAEGETLAPPIRIIKARFHARSRDSTR